MVFAQFRCNGPWHLIPIHDETLHFLAAFAKCRCNGPWHLIPMYSDAHNFRGVVVQLSAEFRDHHRDRRPKGRYFDGRSLRGLFVDCRRQRLFAGILLHDRAAEWE